MQNPQLLTWFLSGASPSFPPLPSLCWQSQLVPGHKVNSHITDPSMPLLPIETSKASPINSPDLYKSSPERKMCSRNTLTTLNHLYVETSTLSPPPLPVGEAEMKEEPRGAIRAHLLQQRKVQTLHQVSVLHVTTQELGLLDQLSPLLCSRFIPVQQKLRPL